MDLQCSSGVLFFLMSKSLTLIRLPLVLLFTLFKCVIFVHMVLLELCAVAVTYCLLPFRSNVAMAVVDWAQDTFPSSEWYRKVG